MEHDKIILLRNIFFRAFVIGVALAVLLFVLTILLWSTFAPWALQFFKVDERSLGQAVLLFFLHIRLVVLFLFLVPALALYWTGKKS